jgi:hypothetical protein
MNTAPTFLFPAQINSFDVFSKCDSGWRPLPTHCGLLASAIFLLERAGARVGNRPIGLDDLEEPFALNFGISGAGFLK